MHLLWRFCKILQDDNNLDALVLAILSAFTRELGLQHHIPAGLPRDCPQGWPR